MDVAVVYESLFGNTRLVAEAIADGIRAADPAARVSVTRTDATKLSDVDDACLLVVGGPTHMRRMTSPRSRQQGLQAARKTKDQQGCEPESGTAGPGLREWLQALPPARLGALAAAFDTRVGSRLAGSASRPASRQLKRRGFGLAASQKASSSRGHKARFATASWTGPGHGEPLWPGTPACPRAAHSR